MRRLSLVVLVALVAFPSGASATGATLGATLAGVPVYAADSRTVEVHNRSAIAERIDVAAEGSGWSAEPRSFELAAGERALIELTAGSEPGMLTVRVRAVESAEGQQEGSIVLGAALYPGSRPEPIELPIILLLLVVGLVALGVRRLQRDAT